MDYTPFLFRSVANRRLKCGVSFRFPRGKILLFPDSAYLLYQITTVFVNLLRRRFYRTDVKKPVLPLDKTGPLRL